MTFYQVIKKYLEQHCEENPEFKERYIESKLNDCLTYITNQAQKQKSGNCAVVDDETVFHWARDFYNEGGLLKETGKISAKVEFDDSEDEEEIEKPILKESKPKEPKIQKPKKELGYEQISLF